MEVNVHCVGRMRRAQGRQQMTLFRSKEATLEKSKRCLNSVDRRHHGKFVGAPRAEGVHDLHLVKDDDIKTEDCWSLPCILG